MADVGMTIPFSPLAGTAESHWLRLVQVGADSQAATMDEAADLIDSLYNVSPCDTGTEGTGGEAADDSRLPDEDTFLALAARNLGNLCADQNHWDAQVDLLRSHQNPGNWQARSETATLLRTDIVTERQTETVTLDGANHYDLTYPYHSGLLVVGADVVDVRGSTVNFARPVTGRVRMTYTTRYERLTFRVPATPGASGQAVAEPAAVIVFWDRLAAQVDLRQPAVDDSIDASELARLCRGAAFHGEVRGDCWQTIEHYRRCQCSDTEAPGSWTEEVATSCPEGVAAGAHLGTVRQFDGYTGCPGEGDEELSDREYYKSVCCEYPPDLQSLPRCRKTYATYRGGAAIESGADYWRDIYGPDVRLVAVTPPDGNCGTLVHEWEVNRKNCCDDVTPMRPHPDNPVEFRAGEQHGIRVLDGRGSDPGMTWTLSGGLIFEDGTTRKEGLSQYAMVYTMDAVCPTPRIRVDDGCYPLEMTFVGGAATPVSLSETDIAVSPNERFTLYVQGGVPPYMWTVAAGVQLISVSDDGRVAMLRAGSRDTFCVADITVSDQCGQDDTCTARNAETGLWQEVFNGFSIYGCSPPGAPYPAANPLMSGSSGVRGAHYIRYQTHQYGSGKSCDDVLVPTNMCGYGESLLQGFMSAERPNCRSSGSPQYCGADYAYPCCHTYCIYAADRQVHTYMRYSIGYILYKWTCNQ